MIALDDFGVGTAPYPFYADNQGILICEWIHGNAMTTPPPVEDEETWHRMMSIITVAKNLPFAKFSSTIPMLGTGVQSPVDLFRWIAEALATLGEDHAEYAQFAALLANAQSKKRD